MRSVRGGPLLLLLAALVASGCAHRDEVALRAPPAAIPSWAAAAPPPPSSTARPERARLDRTVVLGRDNPDAVYDRERPASAAERAAQCTTCAAPVGRTTVYVHQPAPAIPYSTYGWYGPSGGWRGGAGHGHRGGGTPPVGGDWPRVPDHGPGTVPPASSPARWP